MNAVISKMAKEDAAQLAADQDRYAALIKSGNPTPTEVKELREIMDGLDKSAEDLQRDHNLIQEAARYQMSIDQAVGIDEKVQAAETAKHQFYEETNRIKAEREKTAKALSLESSLLQSQRAAALDNSRHLQNLVNQHADLLRTLYPKLLKAENLNHRKPTERHNEPRLAASQDAAA
jgi:hypothetical protein